MQRHYHYSTIQIMKIKELKLKQSYRALILWEAIMKKPYSYDGTMLGLIVLLWCIIEVNNPGTIALEDFMSWIDDNPKDFDDLCNWLTEEQKRQAELMPEEASAKKTKKKAKKKAI